MASTRPFVTFFLITCFRRPGRNAQLLESHTHTCDSDRTRPFVHHCKGMRCGSICDVSTSVHAPKRIAAADKNAPPRRKLLHFDSATYQQAQDGAVRNETADGGPYHSSGPPMCAVDCWEVGLATIHIGYICANKPTTTHGLIGTTG
jgi:hypothetical protein